MIRLKKGKAYFIQVYDAVDEGIYIGKDRRYRFFESRNSYIATDDFLTVMVDGKVTHRNGRFNSPIFIPKNTEFVGSKEMRSRLMKVLKKENLTFHKSSY